MFITGGLMDGGVTAAYWYGDLNGTNGPRTNFHHDANLRNV